VTAAPPGWLSCGLRPVSWLYGGVVTLRNALFDRRVRRAEKLDVPVVSVGNLTVGGTGKTPLVMWLVETARRCGRRPGVLARGYGRAGGAAMNDEGAMLALRYPDLPQVQRGDRVRGGRELLRAGVDLIVLDDGFQHRRLYRDRDLVCMDASLARADRVLLPAGFLREPLRGLRRADLVVLTRAGSLSSGEIEERRQRVRAWSGKELPVLAATHAPRDLLRMPEGDVLPVEHLHGARVGLLSAIARPDAFAATARALGADVLWHERRRDHHRFTAREIEDAGARARTDRAQLVVTEKDEPKLAPSPVRRLVLRIDLRFLGEAPSLDLVGLA
jgi:tetraacyldisaccharide 4'-kinase